MILISGYACLFDVPDLCGDRIAPSAFDHWLKTHGPADVHMLWDHNPAQVIGHWRIVSAGVFGLRVEGLIDPAADCAHDVVFGAVNGLSIGYCALKARPCATGFGRHLQEIELWEISIVPSPMQDGARFDVVNGGSVAACGHRIAGAQIGGAGWVATGDAP